jgi:hypothetical protein
MSAYLLWIIIGVLGAVMAVLGFILMLSLSERAKYESRLLSLYRTHNEFSLTFIKFMKYFARSERMKAPEVQSAIRKMIKQHCRMLMTQPVKNRSFQTLDNLLSMLVNRTKFEEQEELLLEAARTRYIGQEEDW